MKLCGLALALLVSTFAWTQTAVDMAAEPHHHLLMENDQVRVFALTIPSGEQTYIHYNHNFLLVTLRDAELVIWGKGESPVAHYRLPRGEARFGFGDRAIGFRNDRSGEYHGVVVEFLNPQVTMYGYQSDTGGWGDGGGAIGAPVDQNAKFTNGMLMGAARALDVQLLAGDSFPPPEPASGELIVPVTDADLKWPGNGHIHKSSGDPSWIPAGRKGDLVNSTNGPVRFVDIELFAQSGN